MGFYKISKKEAKEKYKNGESVILVPSKCKLSSPFSKTMININKKDRDFDKLIKDYRYFNSIEGLGGNVRYYLQQ